MTLRKIVTYPDPRLKLKAEPVSDFGAEFQTLIDDMIETMYIEDGVGLAAPQIGVSKQIFIACPTMKKGEEFVIVNPDIYETSGSEIGPEGCLSFPGVQGDVERFTKLRVKFKDRHGKQHDIEARNFFARIIQHENDHLEGILLIDRVDFSKRQEFLSTYQA